MKKYIALLTVVLLFFTSITAQQVTVIKPKRKGVEHTQVPDNNKVKSAFVIAQFLGKWQEVKRSNSNTVAEFTDTIFIAISNQDNAYTLQGNQAKMVGAAAVSQQGNSLLVAADVYTIKMVTDSTMQVTDDENILHDFEKKIIFWRETLQQTNMLVEEYTIPIVATLPANNTKWQVYKRKSTPGFINADIMVLKYIAIADSLRTNAYKGEVCYYQADKTFVLPCIFITTDKGIQIIAGDKIWDLLVYKNDANEFVFGNKDGVLYFAKKGM